MGDTISLNAEIRSEVGEGAARALRRNNLVPGIVYGGENKPQAIKIKFNHSSSISKELSKVFEKMGSGD